MKTAEVHINLHTKEHYLIIGNTRYNTTDQQIIFDLLAEKGTTKKVQVSGYKAAPELFMSIIQLISLSVSVNNVDVSGNALQEHGKEVVEILVKSKSICTVNIANNWLEGHGVEVAQVLAKSPSVRTVDISGNGFRGVEQELVLSHWNRESGHYSKEEYFQCLQEMSNSEDNILGQKQMPIVLLGLIATFADSEVEVDI